MRDIKVNKIKSNKKVENLFERREVVRPASFSIAVKRPGIPTVLFVFMTLSIFCYVFLVTSSIFYAVKTSKYTYNTQNLSSGTSFAYNSEDIKVSQLGSRISYINKNVDNSITLR